MEKVIEKDRNVRNRERIFFFRTVTINLILNIFLD